MASFNKIIIVGYLGKDPELRYTPEGVAVCNFSIATTERRKNNNLGEMEDRTTWFRVTAWRRTAEICGEYLRKGSQALIDGRLSQEEYTDRDGNRRQSLVVTANDVQFLGPRGDRGEESPRREEMSSTAPRSQSRGGPKQEPEDDEIPF